MTYSTGIYYAPRYSYVSSNQYGDRYKRLTSKKVNMTRLTANRNDASDLEDLVVLGHSLNVPVHYDFDKNQAYIEVMSADIVRGLNDKS